MDTVTMQFCSAVSAQLVALAADAVDLPINTLDICFNQEELDPQILLSKEQ